MTLLYTLSVGGVLWAVALWRTYPRTAMGPGGTMVYGAAFLFVAALVLLEGRRQEAVLAAPGRAEGRPLLGSLLMANLVAAAVIGLLGVAFGFLDVGRSLASAWLFGAMLAVLMFPLAWLVGHLGGRRVAADAPPRSRPPPRAVLLALLPMLGPLLALLCLLLLPVAPWWDERLVPDARAGVLFQVMLPLLLPTAVLVAWGLDRSDGSSTGPVARGVVLTAGLLLLLAVLFLPDLLWAAHGRDPSPVPQAVPDRGLLLRVLFPDLPELRPFAVVERAPDGEMVAQPLPLDSFFRGTAAMLLAAAILSAYALRRLGRRIVTLQGWHLAGLFALQLAATAGGLQRMGLQAAPWASALASAVVFLWAVFAAKPSPRPS